MCKKLRALQDLNTIWRKGPCQMSKTKQNERDKVGSAAKWKRHEIVVVITNVLRNCVCEVVNRYKLHWYLSPFMFISWITSDMFKIDNRGTESASLLNRILGEIEQKAVKMAWPQTVKYSWHIMKCVYFVHTSTFTWISIFYEYNRKPSGFIPPTQAIHTNGDWWSPCETVKADELSRAGIHLNLHQLCKDGKMSVTDSLFKLMSWLRNPCCPPQDRKAIKYSDLFVFQCDNNEVMNRTEYFNVLILPLKVTLCLPHAPSLTFFTHCFSILPIYLPFLIICSTLPLCAFNPLSICFDPILNSRVHFCK